MRESKHSRDGGDGVPVQQVQAQTAIPTEERKEKLHKFLSEDKDMHPDVQKQLMSLLGQYHDCFSLTED